MHSTRQWRPQPLPKNQLYAILKLNVFFSLSLSVLNMVFGYRAVFHHPWFVYILWLYGQTRPGLGQSKTKSNGIIMCVAISMKFNLLIGTNKRKIVCSTSIHLTFWSAAAVSASGQHMHELNGKIKSVVRLAQKQNEMWTTEVPIETWSVLRWSIECDFSWELRSLALALIHQHCLSYNSIESPPLFFIKLFFARCTQFEKFTMKLIEQCKYTKRQNPTFLWVNSHVTPCDWW